MEIVKIEHLVYLLKKAKEKNLPKPIFFLGAGASKTGGIPLAKDIIMDILEKYSDHPSICNLPEDSRSYAKLMKCLHPDQRNELLKGYIDEAKINVTHIYLAQLLKEEYADYILTVNFDNLMLRALSLFNIFPPTYDMAILNNLTTTTFEDKSVIYLHGQSHGLWLLNTDDEMKIPNNIILRIFDSIKNKRPWIFIGYSGEDPIFQHIKNLGRFDNGLYWVTYYDALPNENVVDLLSNPLSNGYLIKGYDADSFMLKLNNMLELEQPNIVDKPFSALKDMLSNIVDIEDKEHFKLVKERMSISLRQVSEAIEKYEKGEKQSETNDMAEVDILKKEIINMSISGNYNEDEIAQIENKAKDLNNKDLDSLLSDLFYNWGNDLGDLARTKTGEQADELFNQAFEKYQKATQFKPDKHEAFYNWGTDLGYLARTKTEEQADELFNQAFEKYQKATQFKPDMYEAFYNWGNVLGYLARTKTGEQADELFNQTFEKYQKATQFKPDYHKAFYNWGTNLGDLARTKTGEQAEELFNQAFEKYQKAIQFKPDYHKAFYNWGNDLVNLARTKNGEQAEELFNKAFEKYQKATQFKPDMYEAFDNWGLLLVDLARTKTREQVEELYNQAFEKYQKSISLGGDCYNLACLYAIKGKKDDAMLYLEKSLKEKTIETSYVLKDEDWKQYLSDKDFNDIINKFTPKNNINPEKT